MDWFKINFQIRLTVPKVVSWLFSKTQPGKSSVQGFYGLQLRRLCNTAGETQTTILISGLAQGLIFLWGEHLGLRSLFRLNNI